MVLNRDAGEVADFLSQPRKPVVKSGLAGVGRANHGNGAIGGHSACILEGAPPNDNSPSRLR